MEIKNSVSTFLSFLTKYVDLLFFHSILKHSYTHKHKKKHARIITIRIKTFTKESNRNNRIVYIYRSAKFRNIVSISICEYLKKNKTRIMSIVHCLWSIQVLFMQRLYACEPNSIIRIVQSSMRDYEQRNIIHIFFSYSDMPK